MKKLSITAITLAVLMLTSSSVSAQLALTPQATEQDTQPGNSAKSMQHIAINVDNILAHPSFDPSKGFDKLLEAITNAAQNRKKAAENPGIQREFGPFLKSGAMHIGSYCTWRKTGSGRRLLVHAGKLTDCLSSFDGFVKNFSGDRGARNDRGSWPHPQNDDDWRRMEQRFLVLRALVNDWRDMGLMR